MAISFDAATLAAYRGETTPAEKGAAVRDSLGSGTLTCEIRDAASELAYSGTFPGPLVAGDEGALSRAVVLAGLALLAGVANAATWTCRLRNADGSRWLQGSIGAGGDFTLAAPLTVGQGVRLNIRIEPGFQPPPPAWRQGQAVNEWREISGSAMSLCPPTVNPNSRAAAFRMHAWCGLSIDTRDSTVWAPGNGGHDDYHGNEVLRINLRADAPAWVEVIPSTSGFTIPNNAARYSDGSPSATHSYYSQQIIERRNRAMRFGIGSSCTVGEPKPAIDGFDIGLSQWEPEGTYPDWPTFTSDLPVCKDPRTEDVYCFYLNYSVHKWTETSNTVSTINVGWPPETMIQAASAFDPVRERILLANDLGAWTFDPAAGTFTARTLTGAGSAITRDQQAMLYEPILDAFVSCVAESGEVRVYVTDPATFETTLLSVTGDVPPIDVGELGGANPYARFLYDPWLGGVIGFPNYTANGFFLRTH